MGLPRQLFLNPKSRGLRCTIQASSIISCVCQSLSVPYGLGLMLQLLMITVGDETTMKWLRVSCKKLKTI